jgi:glycosyltransferase involved in cell wall biosynthesis
MNKIKKSAVINCFNEELYIDIAIQSIYDYVEEIVVVDNASTDSTVKIVNDFIVQNDSHKKIKFISLNESKQIADVRNFAIENASFEWIVKWDGDFCAFTGADLTTSRTCSIEDLFAHIDQTNQSFDFYLLYSINLAGDLFHYDTTRQYLGLHGDAFIGRKSCMRYLADNVYGDMGILRNESGGEARIEYLNKPESGPMYFVHMYAVKDYEYIFYRAHLSEYQVWRGQNPNGKFNFWEWLSVVKGNNSVDGIKFIEREYIKNLSRHGISVPVNLKKYQDNPKFLIEYKDNIINHRIKLY